MRSCLPSLVALSALVLLPAPGPGQSASDTTTVDVTADSSPAVRLAFYDLQTTPLSRDTVRRYRELLEELSSRCRNSPRTLAGVARGGVDRLRKHGVDEVSAFSLLERLEGTLSGSLGGTPQCQNLMGSIVQSLMRGN